MGEQVKSFNDFITESRVHYAESPTLHPHYADKLDDFEFESELLHLIQEIEQTWINIKNEYWWNREKPSWSSDHFALNVKAHIWPDQDTIKQKLGVEELSDEAYNNLWYKWLHDQREVLTEGIVEYDWVKEVGFGGKSGGWLIVAPNVTESDSLEQIEELVNLYLDEKNNVMQSEQWLEFKEYLKDQTYEYMIKIGMLNDPDLIVGLKESGKTAIKMLTESMDDINVVISGLQQILKSVDTFKKEGLNWFYEYLEMEKDEIRVHA